MTEQMPVITGLGAITPLGLSYKDLWQGLCDGKCGIDRITAFDPAGFTCQIAGQVPEFKIRDYVPKSMRKTTKLMSRDIELAVVAADEAFKDAGLTTKAIDEANITINPERTAIIFGAGLISCDLVELAPAVAKSITDGKFDIKKWGAEGIEHLTPLWLLKYLPNMPACHVGIIHDIQGPSNSITCAEAASQLAIGEALQIIVRGSADVALAGGGEAKVNPLIMLRQCLNKRAATEYNDNPKDGCRPFDADAKGSVFGEAAGCLVLERLENAKQRSAKVHAQIAGAGASCSINAQYEHLEPDGKGVQYAIESALEQAKIKPEQLDLIIPHGTGIPQDDIAEARGIRGALGSAVDKIPVFPTKSMISNTGAAGGAIDVITACCAIKDGIIPAAKNCDNINKDCKLNISGKKVNKEINYVLCCSYTYGGQTAAIILKNEN
ncbi:MAG: beta-ketoacyl-[acyl-carrier-protein] synthase family protein [Sedimentisphaerales bacterium]|nr:beta-ketoacyl-[acyl-carrier-protein] synthase family protein [Sedimentisphaerales bacterium]